ncbi:ku70-like protein [Trametes versicolor FP-101664 SS1]|uniref:ku70-like protein n=1 Tax=Trametes versicolor (strain FP-101664) TaxID=717944 RepID=UPI0004623E8D|nr:ku70-like protein [Trametes versicolor FP-101664 SS1]EIW57977.1 ku70-like protein [Trametes versicolor FP-101664 SS1]
MAPYDDWNKDDDEDEELQDPSLYESKRDVILFCIDCSPSMLEMRDDERYEDVQTCNLMVALEAAMQIQKKKVLVGPNDAVGIVLFNTTKRNDNADDSTDVKKGTYVYQPLATIDAPKVMELVQLLDEAREKPDFLRKTFPPMTDKRIAVGDVLTSCNWVMRDGAPKTATKRIFFITDEDDPHPGPSGHRFITSARTTLIDLMQTGVTVEPFFIGTEDKPFDPAKFYSSVLLPTNLTDLDDISDGDPGSILPESISITRVEELLAQMRFHEVPKRALFSVPLTLAPGFMIGVKGYGLITEQKKGAYRYFADLGDRMEPVTSRAAYVDEDRDAEADKAEILYGMDLGAPSAEVDGEEGQDAKTSDVGTRAVQLGSRVFYTADEVRSFRTLGLEPGIKLLGFKDRSELAFEDNVKHSVFVYPDEMTYSGSKRTFTALLRTMIKKEKIAIVLALMRRNASPVFCAVLPQAEKVDESGWREPPGFHLIPLPFADDIRAASQQKGFRASTELVAAARKWIEKLKVKNGSYPPDSYPNPALAYHNTQLEASAFREDFDPDAFEDLTVPKLDMMHKRAGKLIEEWKQALVEDDTANIVAAPPTTGRKRKAETQDVAVDEAEVRRLYDGEQLHKLRVEDLKNFLKSKSEPVSGKKADLVERVADWLDAHPTG